jgi:molecular chaperone HscB
MQMTTRVNEAYRTLKSPVQRAKYLLELKGVDVAFDTDTAMPKDFLVRQMELRERLEEAKDVSSLDAVQNFLGEEKKSLQEKIENAIDIEHDLAAAKALVRQLMFYQRLGEEVDEAYEKLDA